MVIYFQSYNLTLFMPEKLHTLRRTVLKHATAIGTGIAGGTAGLAAGHRTGMTETAKGTWRAPVTESDILRVHDDIAHRFSKDFGESVRFPLQPTMVEGQRLVAYGITVEADETMEMYYGFVSDGDSATQTAARHRAVEQFRTTSSSSSGDNCESDNFNKWAGKFTEAGGCGDGGVVTLDTEIYIHDDDDSVWAMASNASVIPGENECEDSYSKSEWSQASHDWDYSFAADPVIKDRDPTGTEDGETSYTISAEVNTTGGAASISTTYSQPDVYFESNGSSKTTQLDWEYTNSSDDTTWDVEYLSACEYGEDPGRNDTLGIDEFTTEYTGGKVEANNGFVFK
jgi:hypothetical protein